MEGDKVPIKFLLPISVSITTKKRKVIKKQKEIHWMDRNT